LLTCLSQIIGQTDLRHVLPKVTLPIERCILVQWESLHYIFVRQKLRFKTENLLYIILYAFFTILLEMSLNIPAY
ncbi:hypothetical protein SB767_34910, partial [Bacillus sp. SIMBA_069]